MPFVARSRALAAAAAAAALLPLVTEGFVGPAFAVGGPSHRQRRGPRPFPRIGASTVSMRMVSSDIGGGDGDIAEAAAAAAVGAAAAAEDAAAAAIAAVEATTPEEAAAAATAAAVAAVAAAGEAAAASSAAAALFDEEEEDLTTPRSAGGEANEEDGEGEEAGEAASASEEATATTLQEEEEDENFEVLEELDCDEDPDVEQDMASVAVLGNMERVWRSVDKVMLSIGAKGATITQGNSLRQLVEQHTVVKVKVNMSLFESLEDAFEELKILTEDAGADEGLECLHIRRSDNIILVGKGGTRELIERGDFALP